MGLQKGRGFNMNPENISPHHFSELGDFYPLDIFLDHKTIREKITNDDFNWVQYNKSKPQIKRKGLSLFSLEGEVSGEVDLNSIAEHNAYNGTDYNEMSFRTPTKYWEMLRGDFEDLIPLEPHIGRSHFISFEEGGFFPPHRDLGESIRLISFFSSSDDLCLVSDKRQIQFSPGRLYFLNTRKTHSIVNFYGNSIILVLNIGCNASTFRWVTNHLKQK